MGLMGLTERRSGSAQISDPVSRASTGFSDAEALAYAADRR